MENRIASGQALSSLPTFPILVLDAPLILLYLE